MKFAHYKRRSSTLAKIGHLATNEVQQKARLMVSVIPTGNPGEFPFRVNPDQPGLSNSGKTSERLTGKQSVEGRLLGTDQGAARRQADLDNRRAAAAANPSRDGVIPQRWFDRDAELMEASDKAYGGARRLDCEHGTFLAGPDFAEHRDHFHR